MRNGRRGEIAAVVAALAVLSACASFGVASGAADADAGPTGSSGGADAGDAGDATLATCDGGVAPADGLVVALPFDEGTGTTAHDRTANGNDALFVAGATWVPGRCGTALGLDGLGAYADVHLQQPLGAKAQLTLAAWVDLADLTAADINERIFTTDDFEVKLNDRHPQFKSEVASGSSHEVETDTDLGTGLHHLAITFDLGAVAIYFDGVSQPLSTNEFLTGDLLVDTTSAGSALHIGAPFDLPSDAAAGDYAKGLIDEVLVYTRALTAPEIMALAAR